MNERELFLAVQGNLIRLFPVTRDLRLVEIVAELFDRLGP
jgi:hypothetical protein